FFVDTKVALVTTIRGLGFLIWTINWATYAIILYGMFCTRLPNNLFHGGDILLNGQENIWKSTRKCCNPAFRGMYLII
ncbi:hypothetical protein ACJX0J_028666, partial [Zea mays]